MGSEGDTPVSLPSPPPPNPAARRAAIDAAMRKFDGIEEPAAQQKPRRRFAWADINRRPAGALVAATLIAVIAVPVVRESLPDRPAEEAAAPETHDVPAGNMRLPEVRNEPSPTAEAPQPVADEAVVDAIAPPARSPAAPATVAANEERSSFAAKDERKELQQAPAARMKAAAPPPMMAAPAPPPPPPPPPAPQEMADAVAAESGELVVTGSRIRQENLESASPITVITTTSNNFLSALRDALDSNDRRAVIRLTAIPLRVNFAGGRRTYSSSRDIERDYDRIFTPAVRASISGLYADDLEKRDGGRLRGTTRIWFGCGKNVCRDERAIRVREVTP